MGGLPLGKIFEKNLRSLACPLALKNLRSLALWFALCSLCSAKPCSALGCPPGWLSGSFWSDFSRKNFLLCKGALGVPTPCPCLLKNFCFALLGLLALCPWTGLALPCFALPCPLHSSCIGLALKVGGLGGAYLELVLVPFGNTPLRTLGAYSLRPLGGDRTYGKIENS